MAQVPFIALEHGKMKSRRQVSRSAARFDIVKTLAVSAL